MLTIFDCDGVLIDSEIISVEVAAKALTAIGYEVTPEDVAQRFVGLPDDAMETIVAEEIGRPFPEETREAIAAEFNRRIAKVKAVPGMAEAIDALEGPRCVGSNSSSEYLKRVLTTAGLHDRFRPYIYSAREVGNLQSKPDPNVYLHAAKEFSVEPRQVVVVEDSIPGIKAAVAAGMRTVGFIGGAHAWIGLGDALTEAGAETIVRRPADLAPTIEALRGWAGLD